MHQEILLNVLLCKFEVFVAVGVCIVLFSKAIRETIGDKIASDLDVFSDMRQAVADLRDICG